MTLRRLPYRLIHRALFTGRIGVSAAETEEHRRPSTLPVSAMAIVASEKPFAPFARQVGKKVDAALSRTRGSATERTLLLGSRVVLALDRHDDASVLYPAERSRPLQSGNPAPLP